MGTKIKNQTGAILAALQTLPPALSLPLLRTLLTVAVSPGVSVNELAELLKIPQQTASRYVTILQGRYQGLAGDDGGFAADPLLEFSFNATDPRKRALTLTDAGEKVAEEFVIAIREAAK